MFNYEKPRIYNLDCICSTIQFQKSIRSQSFICASYLSILGNERLVKSGGSLRSHECVVEVMSVLWKL